MYSIPLLVFSVLSLLLSILPRSSPVFPRPLPVFRRLSLLFRVLRSPHAWECRSACGVLRFLSLRLVSQNVLQKVLIGDQVYRFWCAWVIGLIKDFSLYYLSTVFALCYKDTSFGGGQSSFRCTTESTELEASFREVMVELFLQRISTK